MALINLGLPGNLLGGTNILDLISVGTNSNTSNTVLDVGVLENLPVADTVDGLTSLLTPEGNTLTVDAGVNLQLGSAVGDLINGLVGNDLLVGGGGDDRINGGDGNDVLDGGDGSDMIYGNRGNDTLFGRFGNDYLNGGQGDDLIYGNQGNDTVAGSLGRDTVYAGQGNDLVDYSAFSDAQIIYGNMQDDILRGGAGDDRIFGGQGNDVLNGGAGADTLFGNLGDDILTGGAGADRFVFAGATFGQNSGADRITDFNAGEGDRIALNGQTATAFDSNGSTILLLSGGGTVQLDGVAASSVQSGWFA